MNFKNLLIFLIILFLFRLFILKILNIDLFFDEAYYWYWSKHLDFGYYSKPPLIAFVIKFFTFLFGDNLYGIKIASSFFYSLSSIFIFLITKELFNNNKISFLAAVAFITLPGVSYLSEVISTDALLVFFWTFTLYYFLKATRTNFLFYWILAGIGSGLGLLSKPTMIIFIISVLMYIFFVQKSLYKNKFFYIAIIVALIIYLPNLVWNYYHDFIMFKHIKQISEINNTLFHFNKLLEFLGGQFLVFGPIFFFCYLCLFFKKSLYKNKNFIILFIFSVPFLFIISIQAFLERANINWALPTYVSANILVTYYLYYNKKRLFYISLVVNLFLMIFIYFYHPIMKSMNISLNRHNDFYKRVLGWKQLAMEIKYVIKDYKDYKLLFVDRDIMSEMIYYLRPNSLSAQLFNPSKKIVNQFAINTNLNLYKKKNFIVIIKNKNYISNIEKYFNKCIFIKQVNVKVYPDFYRRANIFYCRAFKGY